MATFHALRVQEVARETADSVVVSFDVPDALKGAFAFQAGQYLTLKTTLGGEEVRRSYSLCSAPSDGAWKVGIKKVPLELCFGGEFFLSHSWVSVHIGPGDSSGMELPLGTMDGAINKPPVKKGSLGGGSQMPYFPMVRRILVALRQGGIHGFSMVLSALKGPRRP